MSKNSDSNRRLRISGVLLKLTATAGSVEADTAFVPIPRIAMLYMLKLPFEKFMFGTARRSSEPPSILRSSSAADDSAVSAIGTSMIFSSFFCAVTMISLPSLISCPAAADAAATGAALAISTGSCAIRRIGLTMKILPLRR